MSDLLSDVLDFMGHVRIKYDELDSEGFIEAKEELYVYYQQHALRFVKTLQFLRKVFDQRYPIHILELGSVPYFLTAYLEERWGWDIVPVSVKGGVWPGAGSPLGTLKILLETKKQELPTAVTVFNIEKDRFPFDDHSFDGVLCLETIEHLGYSPSHMLAECHRVLKPDGTLVISTPNSINLLYTTRLLLNRTIATRYSGYGFYGRHQREFTASELCSLVVACNYKIKYMEQVNISRAWGKRWFAKIGYAFLNGLTELPLPYFKNKRENIQLAAQPFGRPLEAYPESLYVLRHLYKTNRESVSYWTLSNQAR